MQKEKDGLTVGLVEGYDGSTVAAVEGFSEGAHERVNNSCCTGKQFTQGPHDGSKEETYDGSTVAQS